MHASAETLVSKILPIEMTQKYFSKLEFPQKGMPQRKNCSVARQFYIQTLIYIHQEDPFTESGGVVTEVIMTVSLKGIHAHQMCAIPVL